MAFIDSVIKERFDSDRLTVAIGVIDLGVGHAGRLLDQMLLLDAHAVHDIEYYHALVNATMCLLGNLAPSIDLIETEITRLKLDGLEKAA